MPERAEDKESWKQIRYPLYQWYWGCSRMQRNEVLSNATANTAMSLIRLENSLEGPSAKNYSERTPISSLRVLSFSINSSTRMMCDGGLILPRPYRWFCTSTTQRTKKHKIQEAHSSGRSPPSCWVEWSGMMLGWCDGDDHGLGMWCVYDVWSSTSSLFHFVTFNF